MDSICEHVGGRIKMYRKVQGLTLQELADTIHKSRATVSKYENGEIVLDIQTLLDISRALHVDINQLIDYRTEPILPARNSAPQFTSQSLFFQAKRLYFYFYDGRYQRLKCGIIDISDRDSMETDVYTARLSISTATSDGRSSSSYYLGDVKYSDTMIRFSFANQLNSLEEVLLYIFNPFDLRSRTDGMVCGISNADLMPCAIKCMVTLQPQTADEALRNRLLITSRDMNRWKKLNMMILDKQID